MVPAGLQVVAAQVPLLVGVDSLAYGCWLLGSQPPPSHEMLPWSLGVTFWGRDTCGY